MSRKLPNGLNSIRLRLPTHRQCSTTPIFIGFINLWFATYYESFSVESVWQCFIRRLCKSGAEKFDCLSVRCLSFWLRMKYDGYFKDVLLFRLPAKCSIFFIATAIENVEAYKNCPL